MANRDEIIFLEDILECIERIENYTENISESDFQKDIEKQDAVIRRIEIIGEAVKKITFETREKYSQIPWREMAGMRDVVIHEYFGVSTRLIWNVASLDIHKIKPEIEKIISDMTDRKES